MDRFEEIINSQMELLSGCLNDNSYLAHICAGKKSESLKEHLEKVAEYACLLVKKHRLDGVETDVCSCYCFP